jgi:conserved hypothetical protein, YceG family
MKLKKILLIVFVGGIIIGAILSILIVPDLFNNYAKNVRKEGVLYVPNNATYRQLLDSLSLYVKDIKSLEKVAQKQGLKDNISAGRYRLKASMRNKDIVRMLVNNWEEPFMLTLSGNIRGLEKLSAILGRRFACDSLSFIEYFKGSDILEKYGFDSLNFMGMFIPNSYEFYWSATPSEVVDRMYKEYEKFWNEERSNKAKLLGLSKQEVSILASIVCEETNYAPEMPTVAGVYINRLKKGMKLDADPTVKFAIGDFSLKRILFKHLEVESPYNTYKNIGLPPGPITIPSIKGIDAVLNYKEHNYMYFCASDKMDGTHKFAVTLAQHSQNARDYQRALNMLNIK